MNNDEIEKDTLDGVILKSAGVESLDVSEADLRKINKLTLSPLAAEDVFTFKVNIGDNETDDRNYEPFDLKAMKDLQKAYIGKTVIKDHRRRADNQVARIYDTELVSEAKTTKAGEPFASVIAKCYMVKTDSNADLIKEIKAGIKKEVSTGCVPDKLLCNICGTDNTKSYCPHWTGKQYDTADGKKTCMMTISGVKEAHELSLVAVPAQKRAGTIKHYKDKFEKPQNIEVKEEEKTEETNKDLGINLQVKYLESFIFAQKQEELANE